MWQVHVPSKVSVFAMNAVNNGLPTRVNKKHRHLEQQDVCQLCGQDAENVYHALVACPDTMALRQAMREFWMLPSQQELAKADAEWMIMLIHNNSVEVLPNVFMLFWHTWSVRIHEDICPFIGSSVTTLAS